MRVVFVIDKTIKKKEKKKMYLKYQNTKYICNGFRSLHIVNEL